MADATGHFVVDAVFSWILPCAAALVGAVSVSRSKAPARKARLMYVVAALIILGLTLRYGLVLLGVF